MSMGLTSRQADCLRFLTAYMSENDGAAPTFTNLMAGLGLASRSAVYRLLTGLEERGYIRRLYSRARAIEILRPALSNVRPGFSERLAQLDMEEFARVAKAVHAESQRRAGGQP